MAQSLPPILQLLQEDRRYRFEAYQLVREALEYAQREMGLGSRDPLPPGQEPPAEAHLTGQQLCEAVRRLVVDQYGYMAKLVLNSWGIHSTGDLGEIVYNLIRINEMKKSPEDQREDFDDVFDFDEVFVTQFKIS